MVVKRSNEKEGPSSLEETYSNPHLAHMLTPTVMPSRYLTIASSLDGVRGQSTPSSQGGNLGKSKPSVCTTVICCKAPFVRSPPNRSFADLAVTRVRPLAMEATPARLVSGRPLRTPRRLVARRLVISASTRRAPTIPSTSGSTSAAVNVVLSRRWTALLDHISRTSTANGGEPWKAKTWGAAESLAAMRVLSDTLGMTAFEFANTLGGHPSVYTKPIAVIQENVEDLVEQLGQRAALQLVKKVPGALARGAWPDNVTYLQTQLGWSADEAQALVQSENCLKSASGCVAGPMMQHVLQLCQEHLGLDPTAVLLRHGELLRSAAQDTAPRVTFIGQRNLGARMGRKIFAAGSSAGRVTSAEVSEINTSFMADTESEWVSRLNKMGIVKQEWTTFERKFLGSADWERVKWAEQEYSTQRTVATAVEKQVEDAIQKAGGRKPKKVPAAAASAPVAAAAPAPAAAAAAKAVEVLRQAAARAVASSPTAAVAAVDGAGAAAANARPYPGLKIVLTGEKVCMTGTGPYTRQHITKLLEKAGAEVQKAVSPTTNYLFCEDPNSGSAKLHKARSWGVKVLGYDDLLTLVSSEKKQCKTSPGSLLGCQGPWLR